MTAMAQLDGLHEQILRQLAEGRCTPRYLAGKVDQSRQLVSSRLQDLQMGDYVTKIDRGLYEITEKGRAEVSWENEDIADTDAAGARFPSHNPWGSTVEDALAWAADHEPFTRAELLDEFGDQTDIKPESLWKRHVRPALKRSGFESDRTGGRATWSRSREDSNGSV